MLPPFARPAMRGPRTDTRTGFGPVRQLDFQHATGSKPHSFRCVHVVAKATAHTDSEVSTQTPQLVWFPERRRKSKAGWTDSGKIAKASPCSRKTCSERRK